MLLAKEKNILYEFKERQEELELQNRATEDSALLSIDEEEVKLQMMEDFKLEVGG